MADLQRVGGIVRGSSPTEGNWVAMSQLCILTGGAAAGIASPAYAAFCILAWGSYKGL